MEFISAYRMPTYNCKDYDIDYLIEHVDELDIVGVCLDFYVEVQTAKGNRRFVFNDEEHPITYSNSFFARKTLTFSKEYYYQNKEKIDLFITLLCKKNGLTEMNIRSLELINEDALKALASNPTIKDVTLGDHDDVYSLSSGVYQLFANSSIEALHTYAIDEDLEDNYDNIIYYNRHKNVILDHNYSNIQKVEVLKLDAPLSIKDLDNFKFVPKDKKIIIEFDKCTQLKEVLKRMNELGMTGEVVVHFKDKEALNRYLMENINEIDFNRKIEVCSLEGDYDLKTFIKYEKRLTQLVLPARDLSPFEKYLYVYNLVKNFKQYKENDETREEARNIYEILDNEFMVCVGYSALLIDLLRKLGIEARPCSVSVEVGLDNIGEDVMVLPNTVLVDGEEKEVEVEKGYHARAEVHIVDPKYGIEGYYIADPTWDNVLSRDAYTHALMTYDEVDRQDRENFLNKYSENQLFHAHTLQEFYDMLNYLLDRNPNYKPYNYVNHLVNHMKEIDRIFYEYLIDKYSDLKEGLYNPEFKLVQEVLLDIGEHIISRNNSAVTGYQYMSAIRELYRRFYMPSATEEELDEKIKEVMEYNKARFEKCFPKRMKIDVNDVQTVYINPDNKFDVEEDKKFKVA